MNTFESIMSTVASLAIGAGNSRNEPGLPEARPIPLQSGVDNVAGKVTELQNRLDRLALVCMAMWSLLRDTGMTDEKLLERMKEIDLSDGRQDGKVKTMTIAKCPQCGRAINKRNAKCLYCGADRTSATPFDGIE